MSEIANKIAVIVNGDTEPRHLGNAERTLSSLQKEGYDVFVLNPDPPEGVAPDHYFSPTLEGLKSLQERLKLRAGPDTELVIVTTGHGEQAAEAGSLCLQEGCDADTVVSVLDTIPFSRRRVYMDQCYSGNWNKIFLNDPKTLFVSAGSKNETDRCHEIAPLFWSDAAPDRNKDGVIDWQERYAHAFPNVVSSMPQFVPSEGFRSEGKPPFAPQAVTVADSEQLGAQLRKLQPGQYAVVLFSASWCGPCRDYKPDFERQAKEGDGQHLWIRTENEDLAAASGISGYPTVLILDAQGNRFAVSPDERDNVEGALAGFSVSLEVRLERRIAAAGRMPIPLIQAERFRKIAVELAQGGLAEKAMLFFEKAIAAMEKISPYFQRSLELQSIASALADSGLGEKAAPLFGRLIAAAGHLENESARSYRFGRIALELGTARLQTWTIPLFERLIAEGEKMQEGSNRWIVFRDIADVLPDACSKEEAIPLFEKLMAAAEKIGDTWNRSLAFETIALNLAKTGWPEKALLLFEKALVDAQKIQGERVRRSVLYKIAIDMKKAGLEGQATLPPATMEWE